LIVGTRTPDGRLDGVAIPESVRAAALPTVICSWSSNLRKSGPRAKTPTWPFTK